MVHGFTLGKDSPAGFPIARSLANDAIGMLRYDNLDLGDSDGNWGDGSFSRRPGPAGRRDHQRPGRPVPGVRWFRGSSLVLLAPEPPRGWPLALLAPLATASFRGFTLGHSRPLHGGQMMDFTPTGSNLGDSHAENVCLPQHQLA